MLDRKRSQVPFLSLGPLQPDTMTSGCPTELRAPQNPTQGTLKLPAKLSWPPPALLLFLMLCVLFADIKGRPNCNSTLYLLAYSCTFSLRACFPSGRHREARGVRQVASQEVLLSLRWIRQEEPASGVEEASLSYR